MCMTFTVKHICGHENTRKFVKCLRAILTKLDLADDHIFDRSQGNNKWECLNEFDLPMEYVKPGICERCKRTGLIANFFEQDPSIEYDILRQWQAHKRASKAGGQSIEWENERSTIQTPQSWTQYSSSSVANSGPETPGSEMLLSETVLINFDNVDSAGTLEVLSPILYDSDFRLDPDEGKENNAEMITDAEPKISIEVKRHKERDMS